MVGTAAWGTADWTNERTNGQQTDRRPLRALADDQTARRQEDATTLAPCALPHPHLIPRPTPSISWWSSNRQGRCDESTGSVCATALGGVRAALRLTASPSPTVSCRVSVDAHVTTLHVCLCLVSLFSPAVVSFRPLCMETTACAVDQCGRAETAIEQREKRDAALGVSDSDGRGRRESSRTRQTSKHSQTMCCNAAASCPQPCFVSSSFVWRSPFRCAVDSQTAARRLVSFGRRICFCFEPSDSGSTGWALRAHR